MIIHALSTGVTQTDYKQKSAAEAAPFRFVIA
jgi:hypothetical protein